MKRKRIAVIMALLFLFGCMHPDCETACAMSYTTTMPASTDEETTQTSDYVETVTDKAQFLVKITYGIDSLVSYNSNTPVQVTITNQGEDFTGEVTLTVIREYAKNYGYGNDISIPAGTTKSVFMTVPANASYTNCAVRILDEKGQIVYERNIMSNMNMDMGGTIVGAISDDYAALNYLDGMVVNTSGNIYEFRLGQMTEDNMPDIVSALSGCKLIVIDNYDTSKLSDAQYQALRQWVENGGVLLLGTGAAYNKVLSKFKDDFVSGSIGTLSKESVNMGSVFMDAALADQNQETVGEQDKEATEADVQEEPDTEAPDEVAETDVQEAPDTEAPDKEESDIDIQQPQEVAAEFGETLTLDVLDISVDGGTPVEDVAEGKLFIEKPMGIGKVIICKTSLSMEPFADYGNNAGVIANLLNAVLTRDIMNVFNGATGGAGKLYLNSGMTDAANTSTMPNPLKFMMLFIIYILAVGPGVYLFLKMRDRSKALWIVIPATALIFTVGVYVISINDTVRTPIISSYSIEQYEEGSKTVFSAFAVMNPKSMPYEVNLKSIYSNVQPIENDYYYNSYINNGGATCVVKETVDHTVLKMSKSQAFTKMYMQAEATIPVEENIDLDIQAYRDGFSGTITNNLTHDLTNVVVILGGFASYFERIPAGSTQEIAKDSSQQVIYDTYELTDKFLNRQAYSSDRKNYDRVNYIGQVLTDWFYQLETGQGIVAGYEENAEVNMAEDQKVKEYSLVLAAKQFEVQYKDLKGEYIRNIHTECLDSSSYDWDTTYGYMWDPQEIIAEYDFGDVQITELYYLGAPNQQMSSQEVDCFIFNPKTADWEQIFTGTETVFDIRDYFIDEDKSRIQMRYAIKAGGYSSDNYYIPTIGGGEN